MKTPVFPRMVALLVLGMATPMFAQNSVGTPRAFSSAQKNDSLNGDSASESVAFSESADRFDVPPTSKAQANLLDSKPAYSLQSAATLDSKATKRKNVESVVDLNLLRNPSPFRRVANKTASLPRYEIEENSLQNGLARISAIYRETGKREKAPNCPSISLSTEQKIKLDATRVLEIVEAELGANPTCACEVVKAAISASDADTALVAAIVQTAITLAPEQMRMISQCAIASMPESVAAVQALLAKIDPNAGETVSYGSKSAKSPKSAKVATASMFSTPNPLDRLPMPVAVPIITSNPVTNVNPSN
jgi:hypothetical protein